MTDEYYRTRFCPIDELEGRIGALLKVDAINYTTPQEFFNRNSPFLCYEPILGKDMQHDIFTDDTMSIIIEHLEAVQSTSWCETNLKAACEVLVDRISPDWESGLDQTKRCRSAVQRFLRGALMGGRPGPVMMVTMELLGRDESLRRIKAARFQSRLVAD